MYISTNEKTYNKLQSYFQDKFKKINYFTITFKDNTSISDLLKKKNISNDKLEININNDINDDLVLFFNNDEGVYISPFKEFIESIN